jgi:hypothetical protein
MMIENQIFKFRDVREARELRLEVNPAPFENEVELEPIFATLERQALSGLIASQIYPQLSGTRSPGQPRG